MAANPYSNLGWNPVPGIPSEVHALQQKVAHAATSLRNCHSQLERLSGESSYWQGDAATKFREALDGDLSTYIKNAARSLEKAAGQLKAWDEDLASNRDLARKYDDEAGERKASANKAEERYGQAKEHPDLKLANKQFPTQAEADAAEQRLRAAEHSLNDAATALNSANEAYNDVIRKAEQLEHSHTDQAGIVAKALDSATDKLAPREPGWLSKAVSGIWEGVKEVGEFLYEHAGTIGAIAGLLALFPTPLAPVFAGIALAASMTSMTKNLSDPKFRSDLLGGGTGMETFSAWAALGGDVLGMVPGGKALGAAGKEVAEGLRMADSYGVAVSNAEKASAFVKEVVPAFKSGAAGGVDDAWQAAQTSVGGSAKLMANITANGLNVAANSVSSLETMGLAPKEGASHNAAEVTKAGAGLYGLAGLLKVV